MSCHPIRAFFATAPALALLAPLALLPLRPTSAGAASFEPPPTLDQARDLHREGRLEAAADAYRAVAVDPALDRPSLAIAHNNLCLVLDALGDLARAETACRAALEIRRDLDDRLRLARTLNNLGLVVQHRGGYAEAEESFLEALAINRELGDAQAEAINLANLGAVATLAGRFQEALDRHLAARDLARRNADEPWAIEQSRIAELNRGVVLERLGAFREALEVYAGLLDAGAGLRAEERASILVNSGVIYRNLGDPVEAIARFGEAAAIYRELENPAGLAHVELNVGIARHLNLGDAAGAEAAYGRALDLVERTGDRALAIETLGFLGNLFLTDGRAGEARSRLEEALALARESGSVEGVWATTAALGEVERVEGNLTAALELYEEAIGEIEESRLDVAEGEYRASFFADKRAVYASALEALVALERREGGRLAGRGHEIAQRAKARDLLDALGSRARGRQTVEAGMEPVDAEELARRVGNDVLLEYFVTDSELLVWTVRDGEVRLFGLGDPGPILEAVRGAQRDLARGDEPPAELLERLSSDLLGALGSLPAGRRLWIAPDRQLSYLPFEILRPPGSSPEKQGGLLIDQMRVSYLPSAWALPREGSRGRAAPSELGFLGFGSVDASSAGAYPSWVSRLALEPLPAARHELEQAARHIPGEHRLLVGADATEAAFGEHARRAVGVIHFATHAVLAERRFGGSGVLLVPGSGDDGVLWSEEIAATPMEADLVVLAGCRTAMVGSEDGRALTSLTGAFLAAGARAVLATLWRVGDQATAAFMEQFYYQLSRGLTPEEALRQTKLRFLSDERWRSAALWSGYVLVGSAPAVAPRRASWPGAALGFLTALALAWFAVRFTVRTRRRAGARTEDR